MAHIGRNDPCACGSGRKYKHCCLQRVDADRALRARLRAAETRIVPAILNFAVERWDEDFIDRAWNEFVLWNEEDVPENLSDDPDFYPLFLPWFLFTYVADPHEEDTSDDLPDGPIAAAYLEETDDLDEIDRALIESACRGGFSFHVVTGVEHEAIELRDILTGATVRVLEERGAEDIRRDDILFAFPAGGNGGAILLGCAPLTIPLSWHNRIIDFREGVWSEKRPAPGDLSEYDFEIREFYFEIADAIYNPQPPQLTNTDGEPFEFTTLTYDLRCTVQDCFDLFKTLRAQDGPESEAAEDDDVERDTEGALTRATMRWLNDKETLLGTVTIETGVLRAEVNSAERAARIKEEISARLGERVVLVDTDTMPAEEVFAKVLEEAEADEELEAVDDRDPELAAVEGDLMAQHWKRWPDEPIAALGNETPRQAAQSTLGRERLEALFAEYRWRDEIEPTHARVDIAALRQKLGI